MEHSRPSKSGSQLEPLHDHFLFLYAIALADLHLDPAELQALYDIGTRRGVPKERIDEILLSPHTNRPVVPDAVLDRVECLYDFALVVQADEVVEDEERVMLERLCKLFGFDDENVSGITSYLLDKAASGASSNVVRTEVAASL